MAMFADLPIPPELAVDDAPFDDDELDEYLAAADTYRDGYSPEFVETQLEQRRPHRWQIADDETAEWVLREMAVAKAEAAVLEQQAAEWRRKIEAWFEVAAKPHLRRVAWAVERLEDYALRRRQAGGSATLTLPSGVLKTTETKPAIEVADDVTVAEWIESIDGRLPPEKAAMWDEAMEAAGLALDSDELVRRSPKVYVGPLRKVARVAEQIVAETITVTLSCDHELMTTEAAPQTPWDALALVADLERRYSLGSVLACPVCPTDSLEGETIVGVAAVQVEPLVELVVLGPDGVPIPGASVRPGGVSAKVELR